MKKKLIIPNFKTEDEEREFWDSIDLGDYLEASDFFRAKFPNLQLTKTEPVSIRFPVNIIATLKKKAGKMGVPYSSLIKQAVYEKYIDTNKS